MRDTHDPSNELTAPFPYFGGKSRIAGIVWERLGAPKHYIEPFCGSAAMLLAAPAPASLEVVCDASGFIANFWRAVKCQASKVAEHADYPVSHIDLGARHKWLMAQRARVGAALHDPHWHGDAQVAGWWLWGQCAWIGSGWCDWDKQRSQARAERTVAPPKSLRDALRAAKAKKRAPASAPGQGVQALGQVPSLDPGRGVQALGRIPCLGNPGQGVQALGPGQASATSEAGALWTSSGRAAWTALHRLAARLERVRVVHGNWDRCLNTNYGGGGDQTAVFLDPPYRAYEKLYGVTKPVADDVAAWARAHASARVALCGHVGDYDMPGWDAVQWDRGRLTYGSGATTDQECVWFSPGTRSGKAAGEGGPGAP